ncbi:MAG: acylase [Candidatus Abyssobacteria bacterium SURF_5]|uniref:Acylase n=1 Tax=Abyssobacteria bacterium (strain SURF_5) TaxID=2093360 RepID=A0A3A4NKY6_ABYX5|nr:MAG: acylase [Candidatus Abyssubacteria bacterium SURF_5]
MRRSAIRAFYGFFLLFLLGCSTTGGGKTKQLAVDPNKYDVKILRDTWGVPHVFGATDADVAFGLAYAHAEDDFETMQDVLLATRGELASVYGRRTAPNDYLVRLLRIWDSVNEKYETDLSPETRALCEAYAEGVNYYVSLHPSVVKADMFPVSGKDIVAGFAYKVPLFFGLDRDLAELYGTERKHAISAKIASHARPFSFLPACEFGSNTFAVGPARSTDGKTHLAINSHQPWEGPVTWYEAHVHSNEGWDVAGGIFPGSPIILLGHNHHLGWASTVNWPDLADIYVLDINPKNPYQYLMDGEWKDLEKRIEPIRVKIGPFLINVKQEFLWSEYGPVVRRPHGTYAIRYAGIDDIRQVEQWYRMNKARTFSEWLDAMRMMSIPMFNFGYADREGNIYYLYNALLPLRVEGYDWKQYMPGNTSETLWTEYLPFDRLPQMLNPSSGFFQNCNSTPFQTTIGPENPRLRDYSPVFGLETHMTNRALRALELFGSDDSITEQEFYAYKFDLQYSEKSELAKCLRQILESAPSDDPVINEALQVLRAWDLQTDAENTGAAIGVLSVYPVLRAKHDGKEPPDLMQTFVKAAHELKRTYGRIDVPWSTVNRMRRGELDIGLSGGPDVLHAVNGGSFQDGCMTAVAGDSLVLLVTWDADGKISSRSIHQYGSATLDKDSPHYADQAPLFARCEMKPVWMDEAEIRKHLEREYRPGEETTK